MGTWVVLRAIVSFSFALQLNERVQRTSDTNALHDEYGITNIFTLQTNVFLHHVTDILTCYTANIFTLHTLPNYKYATWPLSLDFAVFPRHDMVASFTLQFQPAKILTTKHPKEVCGTCQDR